MFEIKYSDSISNTFMFVFFYRDKSDGAKKSTTTVENGVEELPAKKRKTDKETTK